MRLSVRLGYSSLLSVRILFPLTNRLRPISKPFVSNIPSAHTPSSRSFATAMSSITRIADDLEKPDLDDRLYRVIELPNKLEALLVHDAQTDKASASLNVNVGNFSDEEDMPGMAHAVEHLLFMGTEKVNSSKPHRSKRPQRRSANKQPVSHRKRIQLLPLLEFRSFQRIHSSYTNQLLFRVCSFARIE